MTTKMIGVKEFRQNMTQYYTEAQKNNQRLIILRKNEPIFELRPLSKKDAVLEKLTIDINNALEDLKNNKIYSHAEIKSLFGVL